MLPGLVCLENQFLCVFLRTYQNTPAHLYYLALDTAIWVAIFSLSTVDAHYLPHKPNTLRHKDLSLQASDPLVRKTLVILKVSSIHSISEPGSFFFLSRLDLKQIPSIKEGGDGRERNTQLGPPSL